MAITSALYVVLTLVFQPVAYGPFQIRPAEALVVLVMVGSHFKYGLAVGVFIANMMTTGSPIDMIFGSLITLIDCIVAEQIYKRWKNPLALIIPHLIGTPLGVALYLDMFFDLPYTVMVIQLFTSCFLNNLILGLAFFKYVKMYEHRL